jgi:hypothetical protein
MGNYSTPESGPAHVRTGQATCEPGRFCVGGLAVCCRRNSWRLSLLSNCFEKRVTMRVYFPYHNQHPLPGRFHSSPIM